MLGDNEEKGAGEAEVVVVEKQETESAKQPVEGGKSSAEAVVEDDESKYRTASERYEPPEEVGLTAQTPEADVVRDVQPQEKVGTDEVNINVQESSFEAPDNQKQGAPEDPAAQPYYPETNPTFQTKSPPQRRLSQALPPPHEPPLGEIGEHLLDKLGSHGNLGVFVALCSVILVIDASVVLHYLQNINAAFIVNYDNTVRTTTFALSYGVITMCLSMVFGILESKSKLSEKPRQLFILLFVLWTIIGVGVITFQEPFLVTGNGYFSAWGTLIGCYFMFKVEVTEAMQYVEGLRSYGERSVLLAVFSVAEFFSALGSCTAVPPYGSCTPIHVYGMVVGIISFIMVLIVAFLRAQLKPIQRKIAFTLLLLWWAAAFCALTFPIDGPFRTAGNGYFSTLIAVFLSGALCAGEFMTNGL